MVGTCRNGTSGSRVGGEKRWEGMHFNFLNALHQHSVAEICWEGANG